MGFRRTSTIALIGLGVIASSSVLFEIFTIPSFVDSLRDSTTAADINNNNHANANIILEAFGCSVEVDGRISSDNDDDDEDDDEENLRARTCLNRIIAAVSALGCDADPNNNDDGDGDDDGGGGEPAAVLPCVERIARDISLKNRAQRVYRDKLVASAVKRAAEGDSGLGVPLPPVDTAPGFAPKRKWKWYNIDENDDDDDDDDDDNNKKKTKKNKNKKKSNDTTTGLAYANIEISGLPKAGTSHLYSILTHRPDTVKFHNRKEYCPPRGATDEELYNWHDAIFNENKKRLEDLRATTATDTDTPLLSVNGCINLQSNIRRHRYLWEGGDGHSGKTKYVVLFRDPADWVWAGYNFWTDSSFDDNLNKPLKWTKAGRNYRSPELFHEMWLGATAGLKPFPAIARAYAKNAVESVDQLRRAAGEESVLLLRNEDMRPDRAGAPGGFLDRLSGFLGLDRSLYDEGLVGSMTNCNDQKGAANACGGVGGGTGDSSSPSSAYKITGHREMLPETRELVYLYFREECKIWSEEFGIHYPDCVNVLPPPNSNPSNPSIY